ncbi:bifunctional heptose 7-phosphate kinase/heptose 1-phosphate adenyltransferase, partial [Candidatus Woesearchaeota archaeon CG11_big_fil_rev_8_21_14_0_20_57_5]
MSVTKFSNQKILVIGDIMLDRYIMGNITRISPEAPVPIVHVQEEKAYPGGAANVAHNIVTMGGMALLIGVCGADPAGKQLEHALDTAGIQAALIHDGSTVQKVRVVSHQHHIVRLDYEDKRTLSDDAQARLLSAIEQHLPDCSGIIISDYAKGCITTQVMDALRQHAAGKPIIIDPKPANKALYAGATLITPNAAEAASMSGCADISDAGRELVASLGSSVIITRGPEGMSIFEKGKRSKQVDIPTQAKAIYDVSGAGDAVVAALALCVASAMDLRESAIVANHAGGIKVGKPGTAPVYQQELVAVMEKENNKVKTLEAVAKITERLRQEGRRVVTTNGCFDIIHPGHIHLLSQ